MFLIKLDTEIWNNESRLFCPPRRCLNVSYPVSVHDIQAAARIKVCNITSMKPARVAFWTGDNRFCHLFRIVEISFHDTRTRYPKSARLLALT